jgi:hypothetical protein
MLTQTAFVVAILDDRAECELPLGPGPLLLRVAADEQHPCPATPAAYSALASTDSINALLFYLAAPPDF